jgi:benzoate/toluate 1,2-dioxygenase reductase subunit
VLLDGPYGKFTPLPGGGPKLFVAGGIGITPFLPILSVWRTVEKVSSVTVLWSVRKEGDLIDRGFLQELDQQLAWFTFRTFITWPNASGDNPARINKDVLQQYVTGDQTEVYLCGPAAMTNSLRRQVRALGVPRKNIHYERFAF